MSKELDLIDRAYGLLSAAHKVDATRRLVTYQNFFPHQAKEANEGNEAAPGVDGGDKDPQLFPRRMELLERSRHWDYKMRSIARQMKELEAEMMLAVIVDDETKPEAFAPIETAGQKTA